MNHDMVMAPVARLVKDKRVLKLIRAYKVKFLGLSLCRYREKCISARIPSRLLGTCLPRHRRQEDQVGVNDGDELRRLQAHALG